MYEYEWEALPELEWESEAEWESPSGEFLQGEYEDEAEPFFQRLAGLARQAAQSPALRRIGLTAARDAWRGAKGIADGQGGSYVSEMAPQSEFEGEWEAESEYETNPIARAYPDILMEHLGHAAAEAENEAEAEAFIGALVPLAAQLAPTAASAILGAAPGLVRGLAGAARTLRRSPTTRSLVRTLPTVLRQTATNIAQQTAQGQPVTPQTAARMLAQQTARIIGSPQLATRAYQRSRTLDQQYHRTAGTMA